MWLPGHSSKNKCQSTKADLSLFTEQKGKSRALQLVEIYQNEYADKIKPDIEEALRNAGAKSRSERMAIRRATVKELFDGEDEDVKMAVQKISDEQRKKMKAQEQAQEDSLAVNGERTPTEYNKSVGMLVACIYI